MSNSQCIRRNWDQTPTFFDGNIEENCIFENTLIEGLATIIIDKDFIDEINSIVDNSEVSKNLITFLTDINNKVINYYSSNESNDLNRKETYGKNYITDEYGGIIGTKLSSLKGKNVAECSEKSLAGYMMIKRIYDKGIIKSKPSLMLSSLKTESIKEGPHAFILIDRENDNFPIKHLLFDIHNLSRIAINGEEHNTIGLYTLTDDEYNDLLKGIEVTPQSIFEFYSPDYKEVGEKRTFGSFTKNKII